MRGRETECKMEGEFSVRGRERRGRVREEVGGMGGRMRRDKGERKRRREGEKTTEGRRDEKIAQITTRFHCYPQPVCVGEQIRPSIGQNSTNSSQPIAFIQALPHCQVAHCVLCKTTPTKGRSPLPLLTSS